VPDATARAAALNPEIMRAIAPNYFQKLPSFDVIAQDPWGGRRYGFIDPFTRSVQAAGTPAPAAGPQRSTSVSSVARCPWLSSAAAPRH